MEKVYCDKCKWYRYHFILYTVPSCEHPRNIKKIYKSSPLFKNMNSDCSDFEKKTFLEKIFKNIRFPRLGKNFK